VATEIVEVDKGKRTLQENEQSNKKETN